MKKVNAGQIIDNSSFKLLHLSLLFWCFLIIIVDGYYVVIYGSISSVSAGAIGSYTVAGTAVGAVIFGLLADKVGRRKIILICTAIFSLFTALAGLASGPVTFTVLRAVSAALCSFMP